MIPLFFIFNHFTDSIGISAVMAVVMVIAGLPVLGGRLVHGRPRRLVEQPGLGHHDLDDPRLRAASCCCSASRAKAGPVAAILIGGVVCCAAAIGGDNLQDLKCGQLVGSTPWKQQTMQILGVVVAAFVMAPVLNLLTRRLRRSAAKALPAPQANLMGTVAKGVFAGGLPWTIIGIGAGDRRRS